MLRELAHFEKLEHELTGSAAALASLIERAQAMDGVWVAAGDEIAAWVKGLGLPPQPAHERPSF